MITTQNLRDIGLVPSGSIGSSGIDRWVELEPDEITIDVDKLAALGMAEIRVVFEPARCYDSGLFPETITLRWRVG